MTTNGYTAGGVNHHFILPQPRMGFVWDVTANNKDDQQFAYGTTTASWNFPLTVPSKLL